MRSTIAAISLAGIVTAQNNGVNVKCAALCQPVLDTSAQCGLPVPSTQYALDPSYWSTGGGLGSGVGGGWGGSGSGVGGGYGSGTNGWGGVGGGIGGGAGIGSNGWGNLGSSWGNGNGGGLGWGNGNGGGLGWGGLGVGNGFGWLKKRYTDAKPKAQAKATPGKGATTTTSTTSLGTSGTSGTSGVFTSTQLNCICPAANLRVLGGACTACLQTEYSSYNPSVNPYLRALSQDCSFSNVVYKGDLNPNDYINNNPNQPLGPLQKRQSGGNSWDNWNWGGSSGSGGSSPAPVVVAPAPAPTPVVVPAGGGGGGGGGSPQTGPNGQLLFSAAPRIATGYLSMLLGLAAAMVVFF